MARVRANAVSLNTVKVRTVVHPIFIVHVSHFYVCPLWFYSPMFKGFINSYTSWMEDPYNTSVLHGFTVLKKFHDRWGYSLQYGVWAKILVSSISVEELESTFLVICELHQLQTFEYNGNLFRILERR